uniref:Uncharacterized protein n=1 Tax=Bionectria ochroleuca TaxID=29856 RepID=A0A8H7K240_BIOOC
MAESNAKNVPQVTEGDIPQQESAQWQPSSSKLIILISFICFCLPGMYNALTGLGGSGQVDSTVAANANVALLSATAGTALLVVGPLFTRVGPRVCFLIGGWTYALYSGSLLHFNHHHNGAFVIASGALLGVGASFIWIVQGAIMTTYVEESQKGRAIAAFWIIFNLGGGIGSLVSFGLNYNSKTSTVSDSTYIALLVIMGFGWLLGIFICSPSRIRLAQLHNAAETEKRTMKGAVQTACAILDRADVGGMLIGFLLDLPCLDRPGRARLGWGFLLVTGMAVWGGGYAFELWHEERLAQGLKQDIDYTQGNLSTGPIFLYIFYGAYDALWQGFAYWMIGTESNSAGRAAVLVGAYKTFQATGGAMAWRINAQGVSGRTQLGMDWGLCIGALVIALPAVWTVSKSTPMEEEAGYTPSTDIGLKKLEEDA